MITSGSTIFLVPEKLSTDIRAYFVAQKRRRETPEKVLDESISDSVANTVYTFVDREKTEEAHVSNTTDTALAQLYAHIQSLPESSKKKKLIKQFNKQNGQGELGWDSYAKASFPSNFLFIVVQNYLKILESIKEQS